MTRPFDRLAAAATALWGRMDNALSEQEAAEAFRRRIGRTIRDAWEQSKPPDYGTVEEPLASTVGGRLTLVARGQEAAASLFFFGTFATVLTEVVLRLFGHPVVWALELPTYLFIWAFCIAAGLSDWNDRHLAFDLVAEKLPVTLKRVLDVVINMLFIVLFILVLPGTISFLQYSATQPNTGLPLNQAWGYAGIFLLFALGALLRTRLLWLDLKQLFRRGHATQPEGVA